jgi:polar amino acid transport system substrate-binding protein
MPNVEMELVDTNADTVRVVAQGRADAIVENIDFFMGFTEQYPDVKWRVLPDPIDVAWCAIGVQQGNNNLTEVLNIILFNLHNSDMVNETWQAHYGAPMLRPIEPDPFF